MSQSDRLTILEKSNSQLKVFGSSSLSGFFVNLNNFISLGKSRVKIIQKSLLKYWVEADL